MKTIRQFQVVIYILLLTSLLPCYGQVRFQALSFIEGIFSTERLFQFNMTNTGNNSVEGYVQITMRDKQRASLIEYRSKPIKLDVLETLTGNDIEWQGDKISSKEALIFKEQGILPYGKYTCCYSFVNKSSKADEYCTEIISKPQLPPQLMNPSNMSVISTVNPLLTWIPPIPDLSIAYQYNLKLVEQKTGQTCAQALQQNVALVQETNYGDINYQVSDYRGMTLEEDKKYCWQVEAYNQSSKIGATEIWQFQVGKANNTIAIIDEEQPYYYLKQRLDGHTIKTKKLLKIAFENRYNLSKLNYKIISEDTKNKTDIILPEVSLTLGFNQINFDCSTLKFLKTNASYILAVTDEDNSTYYCRFIYEKK